MDPFQLRQQHETDGIRRRFVELRFDGERTLSGTIMRYGDVGTPIRGSKIRERFEPGAFGNLGGADVILNVLHDRKVPIARTGGGGLELVDTPTALEMRATLPDTQAANDALTLVRSKVLRGLSVEFMEQKVRSEGTVDAPMFIVEKAELRGVALADRPAYAGSTVNPRSEDDMTEEQIRAIVAEAIKASGSASPDEQARAIAEALGSKLTDSIRTTVDTAIKERDEAREEQQRTEQAAEQQRNEADAEVDRRVDTLVQCRSLLADDFDHKGKSVKDILVAAAGDEVKDAQERSEDYLLAKVEGILERRSKAADNLPGRQDADTSARAEGDAYGISAINRLRKVS